MESQIHVAVPVPNDEPNERHENAILQMREWLSEIYPASQIDRALHCSTFQNPETNCKELHMRAKIFTHNTEYCISANIKGEKPQYPCRDFLMASAKSRKSRVGETWRRGTDLADGSFSRETWQSICVDIVRYEAEDIKSENWKSFP